MKEQVNAFDYAGQIGKSLPSGILLNTQSAKFNSMVIGWGHLGVIWGRPTFTVYVRQSRYTKSQIDAAGEFSVSVPLAGKLNPQVFAICGSQSGREVDKATAAGLTLEPPQKILTPGIREYPLTLECRVLYRQDQALEKIPPEILSRYYGKPADVGNFHTAYIGEILASYIIKP